MSKDRQRARPDSPARREPGLESSLGRALEVLERIGRLARQARENAQGLVGRILGSGVGGGSGREVLEEEDEHEHEHGGGDWDGEPGRVVLVSRDPEWIFCYWDLAPAARETARAPGSRFTLRLQDVTDIDFDGSNGWSQHLYPLTEEARWWHVPVPQGGRRYLAEVGYCTREGTFFVLGRSESVATLSDQMDSSGEVEMATLHMDAPLTEQVPRRPEDRRVPMDANRDGDGDEYGDEYGAGDRDDHEVVNAGLNGELADLDVSPRAPDVGGGGVTGSHLGSSAIWSKRR